MKNMQRDITDIRILLSLGTNLGNREANLREAIERIKDLGLDVIRESSIYETEPVGFVEQGWFLNQVIEVRIRADRKLKLSQADAKQVEAAAASFETSAVCLAAGLLHALLKIEKKMGRQRTFKNSPRVIDIDLLLFGDFNFDRTAEDGESYDLIIPHPRMVERRFVLEPLCEIAPDLIDPRSEEPFTEILASLDNNSLVKRLSKNS
jgi:7,8-dihydro-6-hydroxymethylpterin-pyrophosphokinase